MPYSRPMSRGHLPACPAWRRVLVVRGDLAVLGGPLVPHRGHPGMEERAWFASTAWPPATPRARSQHHHGHSPSPPSSRALLGSRGTPGAPSRPAKGGTEGGRGAGAAIPCSTPLPPYLRVCHPRRDRPRDGKGERSAGCAGEKGGAAPSLPPGEGLPELGARLTGSPSLPGAPSFPGSPGGPEGPGGPVTGSSTAPSLCREGGPGSPGSPFWPLEPG